MGIERKVEAYIPDGLLNIVESIKFCGLTSCDVSGSHEHMWSYTSFFITQYSGTSFWEVERGVENSIQTYVESK